VDRNLELLSPCGLYCGVCAIYMAHKDNDLKLKQKLLKAYWPYVRKVEDIQCSGCLSNDTKFKRCQKCGIRNCAQKKKIEGCHQCRKFPCWRIKLFPISTGRKVMRRAIPSWRELGTEKWIDQEEKRYTCPECSFKLFRGVKRCSQCKTPVNLD
jgi:hypothetical protein